jgi:hypothetical protein
MHVICRSVHSAQGGESQFCDFIVLFRSSTPLPLSFPPSWFQSPILITSPLIRSLSGVAILERDQGDLFSPSPQNTISPWLRALALIPNALCIPIRVLCVIVLLHAYV